MFEVGFTEIILILGIALLVLGPEKLPKLANQVGRWAGRARAMARQLRQQLDEEVDDHRARTTSSLTHADALHAPPGPPAPSRRRTPAPRPLAAEPPPADERRRPAAPVMSDADDEESSPKARCSRTCWNCATGCCARSIATFVIAMPCLYFANDIFTWLSSRCERSCPRARR